MSEAKIEIKNLYKVFGDHPSKVIELVQDGISKTDLLEKHGHILGLKDISLKIPNREIQVIMGLSGSGKSTLIRHINRLIEPTAGEIWIDNEDVTAMSQAALRDLRRFKTSMVFQKFALLPHRTVIENVAYGLSMQGVPEAEAHKRAMHWIERVELNGFENNYPGQLSGGMQQRVGLARALATDAEILLMDEAFSALDPLIRTGMQNILLGLQEELHKTIVFITHDLDEALRLGDNIAILRDGEMVQDGSPQDIVMRPADDYVSEFIKDINRGRVIKVGSLADPAASASDGAPIIVADTALETALSTLVAAPGQSCRITKKDGSDLGTLTLERAVAALHAPAG
ncbi:glycine betaine/L-proline ABC transporter ATP-binding protein [Rhizobium sp. L1K21]|uniref:quaternary amine ABC transporter ATP-binding protein n=1 Tax=Rhizobium sp. L1K21 TaxID=2954933 RepID=UPI0020935F1D|nr:glycine betaine/L-proline ABC transporter ATP-binding protein [Rhizobium sp. L1K21]MCO6187478.1 glycine betaine/L-proline ABC transporter ATP-binding protein [Rhizobium sp. L1K21]